MRVHEPLVSHQDDIDSLRVRKCNASDYKHMPDCNLQLLRAATSRNNRVLLMPLKQGAREWGMAHTMPSETRYGETLCPLAGWGCHQSY